MIKRLLTLILVGIFCLNQLCFGFQNPQAPIALGPNLLGLSISLTNSNNPFTFNLNIPKGAILSSKQRQDLDIVLKYFLTALTIEDKEFWVNLNPNEPDRMIGPNLAYTDMGQNLMLLDLKLKKDTAFALFPGLSTGATEYWERVFAKAKELQKSVGAIPRNRPDTGRKHGFAPTNQLNIPTTFRVWIVPDKAEIYEKDANSCVIVKSTLKVMLESEYQKQNANPVETLQCNVSTSSETQLQQYCEQQLKELIIPVLNKKVNEDPTYEPLRQIYNAIILANWYKQKVGANGIRPNNIGQAQGPVPADFSSLINTNNLKGLIAKEPLQKAQVFVAYLDSVRQGEYHLSKTNYNPQIKANIRRTYVSGGAVLGQQALAEATHLVTGFSAERTCARIEGASRMNVNFPQVNSTGNQLGDNSSVSMGGVGARDDSQSLKQRAEQVLGRSISDTEFDAVQRAHEVGRGHFLGPQNEDGTYQKNPDLNLAYTYEEITQKARILSEAGFTKEERRRIMEYGVAGNNDLTFSSGGVINKHFALAGGSGINTIITPAAELPQIKFDYKTLFSNLNLSVRVERVDADRALTDIVDKFLGTIGARGVFLEEVKQELRTMLKDEFFVDLQDLSKFERILTKYEAKLKGVLRRHSIKLKSVRVDRIKPMFVRVAWWAKNLGLIDIANIRTIPSVPSAFTLGIATKALCGLGDITKIAMIVNGLFEEFESRGIPLHLKVFAFAADVAKIATIEQSLRQRCKLLEGGQNTFELIPVAEEALPAGDTRLESLDVFITLVRPVEETIKFPTEISEGVVGPRVCLTLGEYDSMVPPNRRMRTVSLFETKTGFAEDSAGFFINPFIEQLYERVQAASPQERSGMRRELLEDVLIEIMLERYRTAFIRSNGGDRPSDEILARKVALQETELRAAGALSQAITSAEANSQWAVLYMHHEGIKYLTALNNYRRSSGNNDSVTIFTFFGETNRENLAIDEYEELKRKAQEQGLDFEFYDLSANPETIRDIDFSRPAVRVVNLGMRSLEASIRCKAVSDLPVGVTGDESLLETLTLRRPVFYEVMYWKARLFEGMLECLGRLSDGGFVQAALRAFKEGELDNSHMLSVFDPANPIRDTFRQLGDWVVQRKLYAGIILEIFRHLAFENFMVAASRKYPLDVDIDFGEDSGLSGVGKYTKKWAQYKFIPDLEDFHLGAMHYEVKPIAIESGLIDFHVPVFEDKVVDIHVPSWRMSLIIWYITSLLEFFLPLSLSNYFLSGVTNLIFIINSLVAMMKMYFLRKIFGFSKAQPASNVLDTGLSGQAATFTDSTSEGFSSGSLSDPATDDNRRERAEQVLGRSITDAEFAAIQRAHEVGLGHFLGPQNEDGTYQKNPDLNLAYTYEEITQKARILSEAGFTKEERRRLMEYGVAGRDQAAVEVLAAGVKDLRDALSRKTVAETKKEIATRERSADEPVVAANDGVGGIDLSLVQITIIG